MPSPASSSAACSQDVDHAREADDGHVLALAADDATVERDGVLHALVGHLTLDAVEQFVLDHQHRIVVADGGLEQPLGVVRRGGHDDLEAGDMGVHRLKHLRVLRAALCAAATRHANDHRHPRLAAEHVVELRQAVDDLVAGEQAEVGRHQLGDGAEAAERGADSRADDYFLGERGVFDALLAELFNKTLGDGIGAAIARDVSPDQRARQGQGLPTIAYTAGHRVGKANHTYQQGRGTTNKQFGRGKGKEREEEGRRRKRKKEKKKKKKKKKR